MNFDALGAAWAPRLLSVLRIMTGLLFLQHGTAKLLKIPTIPMFANLSLTSPPGIAGILELVGGVLMILGLFTRSVAFILSGLMAVAYFMAHAPRGFYPILNAGELAALYCFVFLYIAAAGPGPWSIDAARRK
ncbi:DoxX family protein [Reyranella sp.]|jgi:putative oxidoreductase|uniref:DoxX family protein n=1 Tax=Reyranella sp. TaxID=1929291 RepID=UPI000BDBD65D|nr:DoxX family protein [Reyranella sp.]OYY38738.1 MAG: DoxX family protein [Rhodospirillales bacterium 35-66-84]OYZ92234.1 MAG: DoxX family protein [Rhodospirillales bacterium 24-66-33]OZB23638.1 MAG: DoxX family protein [Rhodospirillales bacterium 39-66-50]HQS15421.1 DoxX family protein [Reyranella sp.]HQT11947.1 DoxX family protein [Reyranella sp.]